MLDKHLTLTESIKVMKMNADPKLITAKTKIT